jgi:light-regulated signal transduction histidine kinase (bacteriophytochrome)
MSDHDLDSRELEAAIRELRSANEELDAFSYMLGHDLRAPLRAIDGFSRILAEEYIGQLDERGASYVNRICSRAHRMGTMIDDLLALARISRTTPARASVDLSALSSNVIAELRLAHPDRQVTIDVADGMTACGDRRLLNVALVNLIGNAWKYTAQRADARIEVGRLAPGEATFFIRDNGAGFDMTYVDKLFAPFQRLHESGVPGQRCWPCHRASGHRAAWRVWAEGTVGEGATFFFTIPD